MFNKFLVLKAFHKALIVLCNIKYILSESLQAACDSKASTLMLISSRLFDEINSKHQTHVLVVN